MMPPPPPIDLIVNGCRHVVAVERQTPLLYVLRNDLALNGPKFGCGLGQCGACAVLVGGRAARSCVIPVGALEHQPVTTLEGLGTAAQPGFVQQAFIDEQAAQCGYCLSGMIIATHALLMRNPDPTERQMREELRFNLCRCGTHLEILNAVRRASRMLRSVTANQAAH
jgi:nicotinate dehydrogenase subunit A